MEPEPQNFITLIGAGIFIGMLIMAWHNRDKDRSDERLHSLPLKMPIRPPVGIERPTH